MIDFSVVKVHRLKDKASPAHLSLCDCLWTWYLKGKRRVTTGRNVVFKKGVSLSICKTGSLRIGDHSFFHANCRLLLTLPKPKVEIGKWVFVGMSTIIASKNFISIGDYTIFAPYCYVIDHEHGFSSRDIILNQRSVLKETRIGRDCYFGTGTVVLGGVTVGDGAIIGAGSVITKNIPAGEVWAGNPARFVKKRSV